MKNNSYITKISSNGQIILPSQVLQLLKIKTNADIILTVIGQKIEIKLANKTERKQVILEAKKLSLECADEWKSNLNAVEAVQEQRR